MFDDSTPDFDETNFVKVHWSECYPDTVELIPLKMLKPCGKAVMTTCFVDADHARCHVTQ